MNETSNCTSCGVEIQNITAERLKGLCGRCHRKVIDGDIAEKSRIDCNEENLLFAVYWASNLLRYRGKWAELAQAKMVDYMQHLLSFYHQNSLLTDLLVVRDIRDWNTLRIRRADLTREGNLLWDECFWEWLKSIDRGIKPTYLKRWEKALAVMRNETDGTNTAE